ncbi:MAG TPA: argininosuccinate lyase, partial [Ruminococcaceae bacterium]|nr:argininosuccinate lyase [Oscillospiraceae bacterium]
KDMQEDKEAIFDAVDTVKMCISVFTPMIATMKVLPDNMLAAAKKGFINATDLADYLAKKCVPFREAYKTVGEIVAYCIEHNTVLEDLPVSVYKSFNDLFEDDLYEEISLSTCVNKRTSAGGTGIKSIEKQIDFLTKYADK